MARAEASARDLRREDLSKAHLGRKPFTASIRYYEAFQEGRLSRTTMEVDLRRLRSFAAFFEGLAESGACGSVDPRRMDEATVNEFLIWMREEGLKESTAEGYVKILNRLLSLFGNPVIEEMRKKPWLYRFPKAPRDTPISALSREELQAVIDATYNLAGWSGEAFRGMLALAFATAARPKEVLSAQREDLDLEGRQFYVRHPKGEGTWGVPQWVPIVREDMVPLIAALLEGRARTMGELGVASPYLFFNPLTETPYSIQSMRKVKRKVEELSGVRFCIKDMRSTFATLTVNDDVTRIGAVSAQLRHSSTETTLRYYARINPEEAIRKDLGDAWTETAIEVRRGRPGDD